MTLYDLTTAERNLLDLLHEGEIDEQTFADTMEAIGKEEKLASYGKMIAQLNAEMTAVKGEIDRLKNISASLDRSVERMKEALLFYMKSTNTDKVDAGLFKYRINKSKKVIVDDLSAIPEAFLRYGEPTADKVALKEALTNGEVKGCHIEESEGVVIR